MNPFPVKYIFPLSVLSFPGLDVSAVSLLSKKGLRYLLYPFISLWMVGGRISPSFTSALSSEFSSNLGTKTDGRKRNENYFTTASYFTITTASLSNFAEHTHTQKMSRRLKLQLGTEIPVKNQINFLLIIITLNQQGAEYFIPSITVSPLSFL